MMKDILKFIAITSLISMTGSAGYSSPGLTQPTPSTSTEVIRSFEPIAVVFPSSVEIKLKNNSTRSGRLTNIDSQTKQITIESSNQTKTVNIKEIERIMFNGEVVLLNGDKIVIRGESNQSSPNNNQKVWQEPLKNFKITDANKGNAEVTLSSVTDPLQLKGILAVAQKSSYVVEEIQFESSGKIQIRVTPH